MSRPGYAFVASLKSCAKLKDAKRGGEIHEEVARTGLLETNLFISSTLIDMYAKCGLLSRAHEVFTKIRAPNVVAWTALIAGYAEHMQAKEALGCLRQMGLKGVSPNAVTFVCCVKACGDSGAMNEGQEIHAEMARMGFLQHNHLVGSALVEMYVKWGALAKAHDVFSKIPVRNRFAWNTLIAGYVEKGMPGKALDYYEEMQVEGSVPDSFTFVWSLKACGNLGKVDKGQEIHAEVVRKGLLVEYIIGSTLVDMYAKCALFPIAEQVFDELPGARDIVSWTAVIAGYSEHGYCEKALKCFEQMKLEGISPDSIILLYGLKACGSIGAVIKGREIHAGIEPFQGNLFLQSSLVDMYVKCGFLEEAKELFDNFSVRDAVLWTTIITGCADHGHGEEALQYFEHMQHNGISPNSVTFVSCLKACSSLRDKDKGEKIHAEVERIGLLGKDLTVGNTLVDMYAKCGVMCKAQEVFDKLQLKDVVSWNVLIAGYADKGYGEETMKYFEVMQDQGVLPDHLTYICGLKACAIMGTIRKGLEIHNEIARKGFLEGDIVMASTLVDMYVKCGYLGMAKSVFSNLPVRDVALWNSLISGYSQIGECEDLLTVFDRMLGEGIKPDPVTFIVVFNVCSRLGLYSWSETFFEAMNKEYGIIPCIEHQTWMVNLLGHSGQFDKASTIIEKMPLYPNHPVWKSILSSCRNTGNLNRAEQIVNCLLLGQGDAQACLNI